MPWAQEVPSSNLGAPTIHSRVIHPIFWGLVGMGSRLSEEVLSYRKFLEFAKGGLHCAA